MLTPDQLDDIRKRLFAVEKELHAIKQGTWTDAVRYQQSMDEEITNQAEQQAEFEHSAFNVRSKKLARLPQHQTVRI